MIAEPLQIADTLQQNRHVLSVFFRQILAAQPGQICAELIFIFVQYVLLFPHKLCLFRGKTFEQSHSFPNSRSRQLRHFLCKGNALLNGITRGRKKTFIQYLEFIFSAGAFQLFFRYRNGKVGQLLQPFGKWKQHQGCKYVKHAVNCSNSGRSYRLTGKAELEHGISNTVGCQKHHRANHIKVKMYKSCPSCAFIGPHCRNHCRHTGADILSHDNRNHRSISKRAGYRQCLQNTHRRGGALYHCRQQSSHQDSQQRIAEFGKYSGKFRYVC
ncbi:hypothetical protein IMSAGC013_03573 [Lachnospiraceae bacterium]|nr:hypothetical protein IMSAGC013_03573 [Lachnospiraceae bacterium]